MASSSSVNSWMPPAGRYNVDVGSSLGRLLKARKAEGADSSAPNDGPGKKRGLPEKEFYSFRYVHKPLSVDSQKQGQIRFDPTSDTKIIVEQPSVHANETVKFRGTQKAVNKWDCVLIYDEDTGTFTLEKVDDCMSLTYERSLPSIMPTEASPSPTPPIPAATKPPSKKPKYEESVSSKDDPDDIDDEIARLMPDTKPSQASSSSQKSRPVKQEEEEEEEEEELPLKQQQMQQQQQPPPPPPPRAYISTNKGRPVKTLPKKKQAPPAPAPAPAPVPAVVPVVPKPPPPASLPPKPKVPLPGKPKPRTPVQPEVEEFPSITNARPTKPPKPKPQPQQPPPPPPRAALALPGSSAQPALAPPPTLPSSNSIVRQTKDSVRARNNPPPPPPPPVPVPTFQDDSDEDDDMEEVTTHDAGGTQTLGDDELSKMQEEMFGDIVEDDARDTEGEEFGDFLLEDMMSDGDAQANNNTDNMWGDDDDDDSDMEQVANAEDDGPISLNALASADRGAAAGGGMDMYDDDDFSSDDSDSD